MFLPPEINIPGIWVEYHKKKRLGWRYYHLWWFMWWGKEKGLIRFRWSTMLARVARTVVRDHGWNAERIARASSQQILTRLFAQAAEEVVDIPHPEKVISMLHQLNFLKWKPLQCSILFEIKLWVGVHHLIVRGNSLWWLERKANCNSAHNIPILTDFSAYVESNVWAQSFEKERLTSVYVIC